MLAISGSYAPTIINGRMRLQNTRGLKELRDWYRLFVVEDGIHRVTHASSSEEFHPGSMYLVQPGQPLQLDFSPGSRAVMLAFIIMARTTQRIIRDGHTRSALTLPDGTAPQPTLNEIWGLDIPIRLAPSLCTKLMPIIHGIASSWWLSDRDHFLSNRRLARTLDEIFDHYDAGHQNQPQQSRKSPGSQSYYLELLLVVVETTIMALNFTPMVAAPS